MKTCETCKFWGTPKRGPKSFNLCSKIIMGEDMFDWSDNDDEGLVISKKYEGTTAFVEDGSSYYAALRCSKDFGCTLHVTKQGVNK